MTQIARALLWEDKNLKAENITFLRLNSALKEACLYSFRKKKLSSAAICGPRHFKPKTILSINRIYFTLKKFCTQTYGTCPDFVKPEPPEKTKPEIVQTEECEEYWAFLKHMMRDGNVVEKDVAYMLQFLMLTGYRAGLVDNIEYRHYCYKGMIKNPPRDVACFWYNESKQHKDFVRSFPISTLNDMLKQLRITDIEALSQGPQRKDKFFRFNHDYMGTILRKFLLKTTHPSAAKMTELTPKTLRTVYANTFTADYQERLELIKKAYGHSSTKVSEHYANHHFVKPSRFREVEAKADALLAAYDGNYVRPIAPPVPEKKKRGRKLGSFGWKKRAEMVMKGREFQIPEKQVKKRVAKAASKKQMKKVVM
jgi:hypothetical protein